MTIVDITRKPKKCICGAKAELKRIIFCGKAGCIVFYVRCTECDRLTLTFNTATKAATEWNKGKHQHLNEIEVE